MTETTADVRVLIEKIAKWMVDAPDQVFVDQPPREEPRLLTHRRLQVVPIVVAELVAIGRHRA